VDAIRIGRVVRALRHRRGWRQSDLARRAGVSQASVSRLERGGWDGLSWATIRKIASAAGVTLDVRAQWRGGELDRLLDADHAALASWFVGWLESLGWLAAVEVTYSRYGERGSIDVLAFHPASAALLVVEIKTLIVDAQGLLRPIDVKLRLARHVASGLGWRPRLVVGCLVVAGERTNRRRVEAHAPLFARFSLRHHAARRWLRSPVLPAPSGLLLFRTVTAMHRRNAGHAGRQRVRRRSGPASVDERAAAAPRPSLRAQ
jgi:transcriptional regulator with XRE-family HTH domain